MKFSQTNLIPKYPEELQLHVHNGLNETFKLKCNNGTISLKNTTDAGRKPVDDINYHSYRNIKKLIRVNAIHDEKIRIFLNLIESACGPKLHLFFL